MTDHRASASSVSLLARFDSAEALLAAVGGLTADGHRDLEAFTPYPVTGVAEKLAFRPRWVPIASLVLTIVVVAAGYYMQWYSTVIDYPYVVGGKPLHSWPAFIPVIVALGLLASVVGAVVAMIAGNRLPQPYHPAFESESFLRASDDAFFVMLSSANGDDYERLCDRLRELDAREIQEVPR